MATITPSKLKIKQRDAADEYLFTFSDTKNTAGSTNSTDKLFIVGAKSQADNPQTYSRTTAYIGTDGCLYSNGTKVLTAHQDISGKVNGPSSATNNAVAFFDGTTGKTIKNSGFTLPTPSAADNGKIMMIVNGAWAAVQLPSASGVSF